MKTIKRISALLLAAAVMCLAGCSGKTPESEVKQAAVKLCELSYEINEIYFGQGLAAVSEDSNEAKAFAERMGTTTDNIDYLPVIKDAKYSSVAEIKAATAAVYSAEYCEALYSIGFGASSDNASIKARYREDTYGTLAVKRDAANAHLAGRTYDFDSINIKSNSSNTVTFELDSYVDGVKSDKVKLKIVKEASGWRLDTPTY